MMRYGIRLEIAKWLNAQSQQWAKEVDAKGKWGTIVAILDLILVNDGKLFYTEYFANDVDCVSD